MAESRPIDVAFGPEDSERLERNWNAWWAGDYVRMFEKNPTNSRMPANRILHLLGDRDLNPDLLIQSQLFYH